VLVSDAHDLPQLLPDVLRDGDLLILMGAGDIGQVVQALVSQGFGA
jgi:UDP-N-acetylmuramate--alanine ligase